MKKNLLKLFLFLSLTFILVSPIVSSAAGINPQTGLYEQSLSEFNQQQQNSPAGQASGRFGCKLDTNPKLQNLLLYVVCIINTSVIPLIFALAVVMFVWGVVQFVINSSEEAKKEKGRQFMIWGIIALAVMISVWGLVSILGNTFGVNTGFLPQVNTTVK